MRILTTFPRKNFREYLPILSADKPNGGLLAAVGFVDFFTSYWPGPGSSYRNKDITLKHFSMKTAFIVGFMKTHILELYLFIYLFTHENPLTLYDINKHIHK